MNQQAKLSLLLGGGLVVLIGLVFAVVTVTSGSLDCGSALSPKAQAPGSSFSSVFNSSMDDALCSSAITGRRILAGGLVVVGVVAMLIPLAIRGDED